MNDPPTTSLLERCIVWIGAAALTLLGLLICASVGLRMAGSVIKGNGEIGEMLIIIVAATSLVAATFSGAHPYVHMLVDRMPKRWRSRVMALIALIGAAFWAAVAWMNGRVAIENAALIEETELLQISLTPYRIVWVAALVLIAIVLAARGIKAWRSANASDG